jgi:tetratricopeptide (TPR) repeat protein
VDCANKSHGVVEYPPRPRRGFPHGRFTLGRFTLGRFTLGGRPLQAKRIMHSEPSGSDRLTRLLALHGAEPTDGFLRYALAQECQKLGRLTEAVDWYDRTIAADPKQFYAYFHKAKALETAGRSKDALAVLRDGLPRARAAGDFKAASEIEGYLDELE